MKENRKKILYSLLVGNIYDSQYLFSLEVGEVVDILHKKGYDFTEQELIEFLNLLKGELNETSKEIFSDEMDNIYGGNAVRGNSEVFSIVLRNTLKNCIWK